MKKKMDGVVKMDFVLAFLGSLVGFLFGEWTITLTIFIAIQFLDIGTGLLMAFKDQDVNSSKMRDGLVRKMGVWIAIILAHFADMLLFNNQPIAITAVVFAFIGQEAISILENLGNIGIVIPEQLAKYFEKIKDKQEEK